MYTEDKGAPVYTLTRRNLKECKDELWERYGEDYQILSKQQDFKGGFLGFGQKERLGGHCLSRGRRSRNQHR